MRRAAAAVRQRCRTLDHPASPPPQVIYNPATKKWSAAGSLAMAMRPRGYHSSSLLTQDCTVMFSGSDVTNDFTAEFFSPPHLKRGPRPVITSAPDAVTTGTTIPVGARAAGGGGGGRWAARPLAPWPAPSPAASGTNCSWPAASHAQATSLTSR